MCMYLITAGTAIQRTEKSRTAISDDEVVGHYDRRLRRTRERGEGERGDDHEGPERFHVYSLRGVEIANIKD